MDDAERQTITHDYEMAVRNCNDRAWDLMTKSEKVETMQAIENYNAMCEERIAAEVVTEEMAADVYGCQRDNLIVLNESKLETAGWEENIKTVFHEGEHAYVRQSQWITEVRQQFEQKYTTEELQALRSEIPDHKIDPEGYYYHPNEVMAREAEARGILQTNNDRAQITAVDSQMNAGRNQILNTYDYNALELAKEQQASMDNISQYYLIDGAWVEIDNSMTQENGMDMGIGIEGQMATDMGADTGVSMGMDSGAEAGISMGTE